MCISIVKVCLNNACSQNLLHVDFRVISSNIGNPVWSQTSQQFFQNLFIWKRFPRPFGSLPLLLNECWIFILRWAIHSDYEASCEKSRFSFLQELEIKLRRTAKPSCRGPAVRALIFIARRKISVGRDSIDGMP